MTTLLSSLMPQLRVIISDNPQTVEDQLYTDRQLSDFVPTALSDMNIYAITSHTSSGTGPVNMVIDPALDSENQELFALYVAKTVFQYETDEARRVGFRITNVAGTVDGRDRYLSNREGMRDINARITAILKQQANRSAVSDGKFRTMARKADPDNTDTSALG